MKRLWLISVVLALTAAAWGQQAPRSEGARAAAPEVLTLDQAVQLALENNRLVAIASLEVKKSEDTVAATKTRFLPRTSFDVLGSRLLNDIRFAVAAGQFGTYPGIGPIPAERTFITTPSRFNTFVVGQVAQPLSQLYKVNLGVQKGQLALELSRQKLRGQQQDVINDVKKVYFAALEAESQLEAAEEALQFYRELDRVVGNYVQEQAALKSDGLDAKAQLAKGEYDVLSLRNTLATRKERLNQLMGRDLRTEFSLSPLTEPTMLETDLAAAQSRALEQRPEARQARLQVKLAEQERRIQKADYIPDISFSFNYLSPFGIEFVPKNIASVGLQLSWEPLDWGRRKHELDEKTRSVGQARNAQQEAEQGVLVDVNDKYRKLAESRALVRVAEIARESAREKARVARSKYAEKAILLKDLLHAQSDLAEAGHDYQKAVLGFWAARADFEKALGENP